ncbi:MAG: ABC transporter ATP-binding protein [Alphaproteobacteria bacterium]|nr:ABC transporter ATP-binding protein [Alphaproteobacteria bacterium]
MIEGRSLTKRFGTILAVDDISISVAKGEVLGFLGPNGAGKSTTMKMITGFLPPTAGTAVVCGHDVARDSIAAKRCIGYLPEGAPLYGEMVVRAFLQFVAAVRGITGAARGRAIDRAIALLHLERVLEQPIDTLSKGFKRRVGLAQAILHDPQVLVLDEPTDGLDPNQKHEVRTLIRQMAAEKAIIISTHILEEVDAVCSRAVIIAQGRIIADGSPAALLARSRFHNAVSLTVGSGDRVAILGRLRALPGVAEVEERARADGAAGFVLFPTAGRSLIAEVGALARAEGWPVDELHVDPGRLDDVFRTVTTAQPPPAAGTRH